MRKKPNLDTTLSAIERIFSSTVVAELARCGKSALFRRLLCASTLLESVCAEQSVGHLFDIAYQMLLKNQYRHEYVYKNAIVRNILLGRFSLNTATVLAEFRVGTCKLDLGILNSESIAYEIKSEYDTLSRLEQQTVEYMKMFESVFVVTCSTQLDSVLKLIPDEVGVMILNDRYNLSIERKAIRNQSRIIPTTVFDSIRVVELRELLLRNNLSIPRVPNTMERRLCVEKLSKLPPRQISESLCQTLKSSRTKSHLARVIRELPKSMSGLVLFRSMDERNIRNLLSAMNTSVEDTYFWDT